MGAKLHIAQFTSAATAVDATIMLGFVPDFCLLISNAAATNPNMFFWVNGAKYSAWPGTDNNDALLLTGSSGVVTQHANGIEAHEGNTEVTSSNDQDIYEVDGTNPVAGERTKAGVIVDSTAQTNSGVNILLAFGQSEPSVPN